MKRVIIVCEGSSEQEFCKKILSPYFVTNEIYVQTPTIKKTRGGIVKWDVLKKQILNHLKQDSSAFVTTFIDYYGIKNKHNFPNWKEAEAEIDKVRRMEILEKGMLGEIDENLRNRYIPYIQLHEFEGLLFNDIQIFYHQFTTEELINEKELKETFKEYDNPEMINDNKQTSPSTRLSRIIAGYNKVVYGTILAEAIGLEKIRKKSPRFNEWIEKIKQIEIS